MYLVLNFTQFSGHIHSAFVLLLLYSVDTVGCYLASSLTPAHLISYDPDRDILPLILANSNYSFEVGKGTQVQYDFISFQHQLDSRFFQGKPLLKVEQVSCNNTL